MDGLQLAGLEELIELAPADAEYLGCLERSQQDRFSHREHLSLHVDGPVSVGSRAIALDLT